MLVYLDGTWNLDRAFAIGYRFTDDGGEKWTQRFNQFKAGDERAIRAGIAVLTAGVAGAIPTPNGREIVVGVPGSAERQLGAGRPVARLASALAAARGATLDLGLIEKEPHAPLHTRYNIVDRERLLDMANYQTTRVHADVVHYLIVDDLFTRGGTIERIIRAVRVGVPAARFSAVALGKTERQEFWRSRNQPLSNAEADPFEQIWADNYR